MGKHKYINQVSRIVDFGILKTETTDTAKLRLIFIKLNYEYLIEMKSDMPI